MRAAKIFTSFTGIVTVMVLAMGVGFGVLLVQQDQEFKAKADEAKEHKVSICHKTGSDSNTWVQIEVSDKAVSSHMEHGDIQGNCPSKGDDKDHGKGNDDKDKGKGNDNRGNDNRGGVSLANNVTVNNSVAAAVKEIETKYVYVTTGFEFKVKFQGVDTKKENRLVRVVFRRGEEELHVYNNVEVTADDKGVYRGVITDVKPGVYEVLIKSNGYLQRKFENINLKKGRNTYNWTAKELLAGDFDLNNVINAKDVAEFLSYYVEDINPVSNGTKVFDIDMNGRLEKEDLKIVVSNLKSLMMEGEN